MSDLQQNIIHTGEFEFERPFQCQYCEKTFSHSNSNVCIEHERIHTGENSKPYTCDICEKGFRSQTQLKVHRRTHTGERPYSCDQCNASFNTSTTLNRHKLIHTGERPLACRSNGELQ